MKTQPEEKTKKKRKYTRRTNTTNVVKVLTPRTKGFSISISFKNISVDVTNKVLVLEL